MSTYTSATDRDRRDMLAAIGVESIEELFADIPAGLRLPRELALDRGLSEQEVFAELRELAARNVSTQDEISFLGGGMYDHYVPALIDAITGRSEFLTPYTPYQPEISQGGLQSMFEYQTAISELTGLPVSNASVYEGPSAVAAAGYMAKLTNSRKRFVISRGVHPHSRETLATYAHGYGVEVVEVGLRDGVTDADAWAQAIDGDTSAVIFQQPNFLGAVEDAEALAGAAKTSPGGARMPSVSASYCATTTAGEFLAASASACASSTAPRKFGFWKKTALVSSSIAAAQASRSVTPSLSGTSTTSTP